MTGLPETLQVDPAFHARVMRSRSMADNRSIGGARALRRGLERAARRAVKQAATSKKGGKR